MKRAKKRWGYICAFDWAPLVRRGEFIHNDAGSVMRAMMADPTALIQRVGPEWWAKVPQ